jgi:hypothetical protein
LRVTAYALDEKGLSIGMVNRKEVAEDLELLKNNAKAMRLAPKKIQGQ